MLFNALFPPETWAAPSGGKAYAHVMLMPPESGHHEWLESVEALSYFHWPGNVNCYFGPALLRSKDNTDVLHSMSVWANVDGEDREEARELGLASLLPPTITVDSGDSYHYYWLTKELLPAPQLRAANIVIANHVQANPGYVKPGQLLRVPGTTNVEDPNSPKRTNILENKADTFVYSVKDILAVEQVNDELLHIVRTGDLSGFTNELERDKYAVQALLETGISTEAIELVFTHHQVGSVYQLRGWGYLSEIIDLLVTKREEQAKEISHELLQDEELGIFEHPDGIYARQRSGNRRVSTFLMTPKLLAGNYMVVSLKGKGRPIQLTLPHSAFHGARSLLLHIGNHPQSVNEGLSFTGTDNVVKNLFAFLMQKAEMLNVRKVKAVSTLGRHGETFVLPDCSISIHGITPQDQAKVIYNDLKRERPRIEISPSGDVADLVQKVAIVLPQINKPEIIWPVIGWVFASLHKPQLESLGWRFPFLCLFGIRGSGKTNLIHTLMLRMLGYTSTGGTSADTTKFVMLALFASSNALPVSFSEFRHAGEGAKDLVPYLKLAYDSGRDPRGKTDQTTVEYPLTAPVILDGEELVGDPAARERMIAVAMSPKNIVPGSDCFRAFRELESLGISQLAEFIYCESLKVDLAQELAAAERDFDREPETDLSLPDRVRRNHIVCWVGCRLFAQIFSMEVPDMTRVMRPSIEEVLGQVRGGQIIADEFVEDLIASLPNLNVPHVCTEDGDIITVPLHKAHKWWKLSRGRSGDKTPAKSVLLKQLKERRETYIKDVERGEAGLLICISLSMAIKMGLEVPEKLGAGPRLRTKKGEQASG